MESHSEYRKRIMRISVRQYFHYVFYNPRLVCRIMGSLNVIFFMAIGMILLWNIWCEEYSRLQLSSISKPSDLGTIDVINIFKIINMWFLRGYLGLSSEFSFTFHYLMMEARIVLRLNSDGPNIECKWCHSLIPDLFLVVNFYLLKATFKKNILSIDAWLVLHGLDFLYMLSVNVFTINYYAYTLIYTCIYCMYLLLVISFRMEESNNSIFHKIIKYLHNKIEHLRMR